MDGAVGFGSWLHRVGLIGEKKETGGSTASVGQDQVRCLGNDAEYHIACMEADDGVRMGGEIIEQHLAGFGSLLCGTGLAVGDFVECDDDGLVDGSAIIQEDSRDLLDALDAKFVEERRDVVVGELDLRERSRDGAHAGGA